MSFLLFSGFVSLRIKSAGSAGICYEPIIRKEDNGPKVMELRFLNKIDRFTNVLIAISA